MRFCCSTMHDDTNNLIPESGDASIAGADFTLMDATWYWERANTTGTVSGVASAADTDYFGKWDYLN